MRETTVDRIAAVVSVATCLAAVALLGLALALTR